MIERLAEYLAQDDGAQQPWSAQQPKSTL